MCGQHQAPTALPPGRLGGPQGRCGRVWEISPLPRIRSPDRPVRSESLYRLSYIIIIIIIIIIPLHVPRTVTTELLQHYITHNKQ